MGQQEIDTLITICSLEPGGVEPNTSEVLPPNRPKTNLFDLSDYNDLWTDPRLVTGSEEQGEGDDQ